MFSKSVNLFFKNPIIGLPSLFLALITSLFARFMIGSKYLRNFDSNSITGLDTFPAELARTVSSFLLYAIIVILFEPIIQAVTIVLSKNALDGNKDRFQDAVRSSFKYYWRLLAVLVFKLFLLIGISIGTIIVILPSLTKFVASPQNFPYGLVLVVFSMVLLILLFSILLLPIEPILVYDDLSLGDSITKGLKFGFRKLPSLIGVTLLVGIGSAVINYVLSLFIGDIAEISSSITSYFSVCVNIYILCIYKDNIDKANVQYKFNETIQDETQDDHFSEENSSTNHFSNINLLKDNQANENPNTDTDTPQSMSQNRQIVEEKKDDSNKFIV
jgi:hypothetical protein